MAKYYKGLDVIRAMACIGIILMHMASRDNNEYVINGILFSKIIPSFTDFVFLFMIVSAFSICNRYYDNIISGRINLEAFYKRRYLKILPFFAVVVVLDLIINFSKESLYEALANVSLTFGLFPNSISVIGVGWFLGLIFGFYMIFPIYCIWLGNKKRAWFFFVATLILNHICEVYFKLDRNNIVYSLCYFVAGGLIFLYRVQLEKVKWYISFAIMIMSIGTYYLICVNTYTRLFLFAMICIVAMGQLGDKIHNNCWQFISRISMEMYLSHMVVFRGLEQLGLTKLFGSGWKQYVMTVFLVIAGTIVFVSIVNWGIKWMTISYLQYKNNKT